MKTIKEVFEKRIKDIDFWSYYSRENAETFDESIFSCNDNAFYFIKSYFERGGKEKLLELKLGDFEKEKLKDRALHTVSTFFLGLLIAEQFGINLCKKNSTNMDFKYYWFLACLYHDIAYVYEVNTCHKLRMVVKDGFEAIQTICDVKYIHQRIFRTYKKETIERYLVGRARCDEERGSIDHGIVGGLMLYDRLRKQFEDSWEKIDKTNSDTDVTRSDFHVKKNGHCLHLSNKHFEEYAVVANAVIIHNIWQNKFNEIAGRETFKRICMGNGAESHPEECIAFILALADTIELAKRNDSNINFLEEVSLCEGTTKHNGEFCVHFTKKAYAQVKKAIDDLQCWVDAKIDIDNKCDGSKKVVFSIQSPSNISVDDTCRF